jgi:putative chitinase
MQKEKILNFYPGNQNAIDCVNAVEAALKELGIYSDLVLVGAVATVRVEVGKTFKPAMENLNYSADRLLQIFPKYYNTATASEHAHKPEKIANRVYANRMGNGDEASGEGYRYRGANFIQFTGRNNWNELGMTPENCLDIKIGARGVANFFKTRGIDKHCNAKDWTMVRKRVNGGYHGLELFKQVVEQYIN